MNTQAKITKKEIHSVLRTMDSTQIFRIAKLSGVDVSKSFNVTKFIENYAPTQRIARAAYRLGMCADHKNQMKAVHGRLNQPIRKAVAFAKEQVAKGTHRTSYGKILIEGNSNIYWASPAYGHSDYNKHIAFPNTLRNRKVMQLINAFIANH
jgi:hypothetical protein